MAKPKTKLPKVWVSVDDVGVEWCSIRKPSAEDRALIGPVHQYAPVQPPRQGRGEAMTTGKPKMPLIENCALCRVCGKGELSCSCDKPEPMSVDEAILLVLTGLGTERRQVAEVIRSLDERARRAERNFEQAAACHKEALCWYNEAKAQVAAQEQSHRDILQSVGEEATRQIAELTKDQEDWRKGVGFISACLGLDTLSTVDLGERALEIRAAIAEKDKRIAELEAALSGGTM